MQPVSPRPFHNYSWRYYSKRVGFRWSVFFIDHFDKVERKVCGPFWRWRTAERMAMTFTQHCRSGWDMGNQGRAVFGGRRNA
jgi:hypothetical protein